MAMVNCRECQQQVSSEAPKCPHCGITKPAPPTALSMRGQWRWAFLLFFGFIVFKCASVEESTKAGDSSSTLVSTPMRSPDIVRQEEEARERERLANLPRKEMIAMLSERLLLICKTINSRLNYIEVKVRGSGLYCVHDFYSQYSLKIGPLGPSISEFTSNNIEHLKRAKITRVGVWGVGEYASGAWFTVE